MQDKPVKVIKTKDYHYELPEGRIAQDPSVKRDESKLMVVDRKDNTITHKKFSDITEYLRAGDLLVVNESKVIPARLYGTRDDTDSCAEFLLLEQKNLNTWEVIMKPGKKGKQGNKFSFGGGILRAEVIEARDDGNKIVKFYYDGEFYSVLEKIGIMPLPPYITKSSVDVNERYQTVYAKTRGSSAAPTAGLHFTENLLEKIKAMGIGIVPITLHIGLGTFRPVKVDDASKHKMHEENYYISEESAAAINAAKKDNRRVICVGTTSCRTLEACWLKNGKIIPGNDKTDIFIYEGFDFKATDALITNFHLPESTLLMLVSAFYDRKKILDAYEIAVSENYRFFSFGDAMFIN